MTLLAPWESFQKRFCLFTCFSSSWCVIPIWLADIMVYNNAGIETWYIQNTYAYLLYVFFGKILSTQNVDDALLYWYNVNIFLWWILSIDKISVVVNFEWKPVEIQDQLCTRVIQKVLPPFIYNKLILVCVLLFFCWCGNNQT